MCLSAAPKDATWCGEALCTSGQCNAASATFSRRAAEGGQPIHRTSKVEGRRHRRCRDMSRGDSCEVSLIPSTSSGRVCCWSRDGASGKESLVHWPRTQLRVSTKHSERSRITCDDRPWPWDRMRRRVEHCTHTRSPPTRTAGLSVANFRPRCWLWTASPDDAVTK